MDKRSNDWPHLGSKQKRLIIRAGAAEREKAEKLVLFNPNIKWEGFAKYPEGWYWFYDGGDDAEQCGAYPTLEDAREAYADWAEMCEETEQRWLADEIMEEYPE